MERLVIVIDGMSCGHCVRQVGNALRRLDGVQIEDVRVGEALVSYDPVSISEREIEQAIHDLGYRTKAVGRAA
ncbi:MAG: heavy-metal-associated domain-containing protein [Nitrospiraceae bacterium]